MTRARAPLVRWLHGDHPVARAAHGYQVTRPTAKPWADRYRG